MQRPSASLFALLAADAFAAGPVLASEPPAPVPTALEAFVANPNVVIAFSERVGGIESDDATLEVTALVAEDSADASRRMRGVKFSLANNDSPWRAHGTASCWMPERPERILCPGYVVGPDGSRMTMAAYGGDQGFAFPARRPAELAALVERAIAAFAAR